jgi:hypothetical protein
MTTRHHDHRKQERRTHIIAAAVTGLLAGLIKAVATWLIDHLTTAC